MKLFRFAVLTLSLVSFSSALAATLSESPGSIAQGGAVTATWGAIANPSPRDWIGLYVAGAGDGAFHHWVYVSCTRNPGSAAAAGSCPLGIAGNLPNGTYELRLYSNDGFSRLATSNQFNVAPINVVPPPSARFEDNGDGTVTDNQTGLMWEKKLAANGSQGGNCASVPASLHCVNRAFTWSGGSGNPDGTLYTDFLARINKVFSVSPNGVAPVDECFAGYCDWRIPNINDLKTILDCSHPNCIDPVFGPTVPNRYWSSTTDANSVILAWNVYFGTTGVTQGTKTEFGFARAVRSYR